MAHHQPIRRPTAGAGTSSGGTGEPPAHAPRDIPDKLYFRIGEVARLCEVPAYVLRFWESEFPQLKPNKGGTGQRLFRRRDVEIALRIKRLLYDEGYTIPGARQLLKTEAKVKEPLLPLLTDPSPRERTLHSLRSELQDLLLLLQAAPGQRTDAAEHDPPRSSGRVTQLTRRRSHLATMPGTVARGDGLFDFPARASTGSTDHEDSTSTP